MLIVINLINSNGAMVVVLANMRWSVFVSIKLHKLVVSTSFWSWLLNVSSVLTSLKYTATFFGLLICCGNAEGSWEYKSF